MLNTTKKYFTALSLLALMLGFSQNALALVELRGSYGFQAVDPEKSVSTAPELTKLEGFGADVIVSPPLFPLAFGLRYEMMGAEEESSGVKLEVEVTRVAALVGMRLIDTLIFVGPIGSLGLTHGGETKLKDALGNTVYKYDTEIDFSYSVGVEAGVKLTSLLLGAEVGYLGMTLNGKNGAKDQDLNGIYAKALVGFAF